MKKKYTLAILLIIVVLNCFSNNITISNTTIASRNTIAGYALIQFDISWDNSWRTSSGPSNWDAAWVFIKFRVKGEEDWLHASLNWSDGTGTGDGHTVPAGATIKGAKDLTGVSFGVFIYSTGDKAQGPANYDGVQLRWKYEIDGVADTDLVEICVFGIEMVYVPEGGFELGNHPELSGAFYTSPAVPPNAFNVTSEALAIPISPVSGLYYGATGGDQAGSISSAFPKGYKAFYCMKYEITQEQYVEFLLKVTEGQAGARAYTLGANRHDITGVFGTYTTGSPYLACNYLSWGDLAAYLDWAALRPMTELEYEKACRGTVSSLPFELAWGAPFGTSQPYTLENAALEDEGIETNFNIALGNFSHAGTDGALDGPLRVGIFAAHPSNNGRITAGATYYGIMEMTGNLYEQAVTVGNATGRLFTGAHGDGSLAANGNSNVAGWPGTDAVGAGLRGGSWNTSHGANSFFCVSSRSNSVNGAANRENDKGGRGVRTAP